MAQVTVFSQAHKAFRDTPRFRFVQSDPEIVDRYRALTRTTPLLGNAVGLYMNPGSVEPEAILVAERGLLIIGSSSPLRVEFSDIESIRSPSGEDDRSDIALVLRSGTVVNLRVGGEESRFQEIFRFVRFLDRVVADR